MVVVVPNQFSTGKEFGIKSKPGVATFDDDNRGGSKSVSIHLDVEGNEGAVHELASAARAVMMAIEAASNELNEPLDFVASGKDNERMDKVFDETMNAIRRLEANLLQQERKPIQDQNDYAQLAESLDKLLASLKVDLDNLEGLSHRVSPADGSIQSIYPVGKGTAPDSASGLAGRVGMGAYNKASAALHAAEGAATEAGHAVAGAGHALADGTSWAAHAAAENAAKARDTVGDTAFWAGGKLHQASQAAKDTAGAAASHVQNAGHATWESLSQALKAAEDEMAAISSATVNAARSAAKSAVDTKDAVRDQAMTAGRAAWEQAAYTGRGAKRGAEYLGEVAENYLLNATRSAKQQVEDAMMQLSAAQHTAKARVKEAEAELLHTMMRIQEEVGKYAQKAGRTVTEIPVSLQQAAANVEEAARTRANRIMCGARDMVTEARRVLQERVEKAKEVLRKHTSNPSHSIANIQEGREKGPAVRYEAARAKVEKALQHIQRPGQQQDGNGEDEDAKSRAEHAAWLARDKIVAVANDVYENFRSGIQENVWQATQNSKQRIWIPSLLYGANKSLYKHGPSSSYEDPSKVKNMGGQGMRVDNERRQGLSRAGGNLNDYVKERRKGGHFSTGQGNQPAIDQQVAKAQQALASAFGMAFQALGMMQKEFGTEIPTPTLQSSTDLLTGAHFPGRVYQVVELENSLIWVAVLRLCHLAACGAALAGALWMVIMPPRIATWLSVSKQQQQAISDDLIPAAYWIVGPTVAIAFVTWLLLQTPWSSTAETNGSLWNQMGYLIAAVAGAGTDCFLIQLGKLQNIADTTRVQPSAYSETIRSGPSGKGTPNGEQLPRKPILQRFQLPDTFDQAAKLELASKACRAVFVTTLALHMWHLACRLAI